MGCRNTKLSMWAIGCVSFVSLVATQLVSCTFIALYCYMILVLLCCPYFVSLFLALWDKRIQLTCIVAVGTLYLNILFKVEAGERIRAELIVEGPCAISTLLSQNILLPQLPLTFIQNRVNHWTQNLCYKLQSPGKQFVFSPNIIIQSINAVPQNNFTFLLMVSH